MRLRARLPRPVRREDCAPMRGRACAVHAPALGMSAGSAAAACGLSRLRDSARGLVALAVLTYALCFCAPVQAQATPFDGKWNVTHHCPPQEGVEGAKGYTHYYTATVSNGELIGVHGKEGEPGWHELRGPIGPDGTATLRLRGIVSNPNYAANQAPRGKAYAYRISAKFEESTGTGQRNTARSCEFRFSR